MNKDTIIGIVNLLNSNDGNVRLSLARGIFTKIIDMYKTGENNDIEFIDFIKILIFGAKLGNNGKDITKKLDLVNETFGQVINVDEGLLETLSLKLIEEEKDVIVYCINNFSETFNIYFKYLVLLYAYDKNINNNDIERLKKIFKE